MKNINKPMTSDQRQALRMMADGNHGAIVTRFGWTWPQSIRESEEVASEVIRVLSCK